LRTMLRNLIYSFKEKIKSNHFLKNIFNKLIKNTFLKRFLFFYIFKKNKNLNNESKNISNYTNISKNDNLISNPLNSEDPNKIFYSLIDNSESLEETSNINNSLRKSELNQINMNSRKANFSKKLTTEEELYDEFNYLLDE